MPQQGFLALGPYVLDQSSLSLNHALYVLELSTSGSSTHSSLTLPFELSQVKVKGGDLEYISQSHHTMSSRCDHDI